MKSRAWHLKDKPVLCCWAAEKTSMSKQCCPGGCGTFLPPHWQLLTQTLLLLPGGESAPLTLWLPVLVPKIPELPQSTGKAQEAVTRCLSMWEVKNRVWGQALVLGGENLHGGSPSAGVVSSLCKKHFILLLGLHPRLQQPGRWGSCYPCSCWQQQKVLLVYLPLCFSCLFVSWLIALLLQT